MPADDLFFRKIAHSDRLLGTPQDITLQELRVESFFPMDSETTVILRGWVADAGTDG